MNGYDPQTRRGGFWPTEVSPVDGLLGAASPTLPEVDGDEADILQESEAEASSSQPDGTVRPFVACRRLQPSNPKHFDEKKLKMRDVINYW